MIAENLFQAAQEFVAAAAELHRERPWSMNDHIFSTVVDKLTKNGNTFASQFQIFDGIAGRTCHEFKDMMSLALSACLVSYYSPQYTHFVINITPRLMNRIIQSSENFDDVYEFVVEFWESTNGG